MPTVTYCWCHLRLDTMFRTVPICLAIYALLNPGHGISSKMDFGNDEVTSVVTNETKSEDEDVEVKHTIVVSTRLKNNNRRGLHGRGEGESGVLTYNIGRNNKDDSEEVPIEAGYKSVETTQIRTPDTRHKAQIYPDAVFINRNIRDEYDIYPNVALTPNQWKPSSFFNNINNNGWQQNGESFQRRNYRPINNNKLNRKITDDAMKEFYCKKCRELISSGRSCIQQRSAWLETTTQKMKIDGKLAKLN